MIHLCLRLAIHDQRDGLGEWEDGPAVERNELLAIELEIDGHDRTGRPA